MQSFNASNEDRIDADHEPTCPQTAHVFENRIEVILSAGIQDMQLQPEFAGSRHHRTRTAENPPAVKREAER